MPALLTLERQATAALRRAGYAGTKLVVAASGGPDSTALLRCLHKLAPAHGLTLHVAHLIHDFRGQEAEDDARFVADLAAQLGLPVTVEQRDVPAYQKARRISSFEQGARELRYAFLAQVVSKAGAASVAVGHTEDDLAETALLHILRGSGLSGLRSMTEVAPWPFPGLDNLRVFRPLLGVTKAATAAYCDSLGQPYRRDTTNEMRSFTRNRVRHELLPYLATEYNPQIKSALARLARSAAHDLEYLEGEVSRLWPKLAKLEGDTVWFDRAQLAALHESLRRLALRRGYALLAGGARRLEETHVTAMARAATGRSGQILELPGGCWLFATPQQLALTTAADLPCPYPMMDREFPLKMPTASEPERALKLGGWSVGLRWRNATPGAAPPADPWTAWLDAAALGGECVLRSWRPGDRFQPLGMAREKKLQDFFTDAGVPRPWRNAIPLLDSPRGIAWVGGHRVAEWSKARLDAACAAPVIEITLSHSQG